MDYQIKSTKKSNKGFSLVEIILVLGIMGFLVSVTASVYLSFKAHENLEIVTLGLVEAIRHAEVNAEVGKTDSKWGVAILANSVVVFRGSSYAGRNQIYDQTFNFLGGVTSSGLSEIVFEKLRGSTLNNGTITLTNRYGSKNILINEKGTITY